MLAISGVNLLGLTHNEAVRALKCGAEAKNVSLKYIDGPETCDGIANFTPSWSYWLQLPRYVLTPPGPTGYNYPGRYSPFLVLLATTTPVGTHPSWSYWLQLPR